MNGNLMSKTMASELVNRTGKRFSLFSNGWLTGMNLKEQELALHIVRKSWNFMGVKSGWIPITMADLHSVLRFRFYQKIKKIEHKQVSHTDKVGHPKPPVVYPDKYPVFRYAGWNGVFWYEITIYSKYINKLAVIFP